MERPTMLKIAKSHFQDNPEYLLSVIYCSNFDIGNVHHLIYTNMYMGLSSRRINVYKDHMYHE